MDFRYTVKIYRPENPCKTEEILILNPAGLRQDEELP